VNSGDNDLGPLNSIEAKTLVEQLVREKDELTFRHLRHVSDSEKEQGQLKNKLKEAEKHIAELEAQARQEVVDHDAETLTGRSLWRRRLTGRSPSPARNSP
jgi:hypothetical protein